MPRDSKTFIHQPVLIDKRQFGAIKVRFTDHTLISISLLHERMETLDAGVRTVFVDFMLARHILLECRCVSVRPSVRHKPVSYHKNSSGDEIANVLVNDDIAHT